MSGLFYRYCRSIVLFCLVALLAVTFPLPSVSSQDDILLNLNQAQTLLDQGNFNRASAILESLEGELPKKAYPYYQAITANLFLRQGLFNQAIDIYSQLYQEQFGNKTNNRLSLLDNYIQATLGRARIYSFLATDDIERRDEFLQIVDSDRTLATELATEAVELSESNSVRDQIRASLNLGKISDNLVDLAALTVQIESLSTSRDKAEFLLELAKLSPNAYPIIKKAIDVALEAQDPLSLSWTWKALGEYYEQKGLYEKALEASYRLIWASEEVQDWVGSIQGQWLSARVYEKLQQSAQADAAYRNVVNTVKTLRSDLAGSPVGQTLFFDTIDPILRDFLSFLLSQPIVSQEALEQTIEIIRLNQLAELDNFFGDICQIELDSRITQRAEDVFIYTLLLPEDSYEIMKFSDGSYQLIKLGITGDSLKQIVLDWRKNLTDAFYGNYRPGSKNLYEILIKPITLELELKNIEHIIFVQDSLLRNIPMSGLFNKNSQQFLIENYLISYSLDLAGSLVKTPPKNALIVGSSEPTSTFPNALPGVIEETKLIQKLIGGTRLIRVC